MSTRIAREFYHDRWYVKQAKQKTPAHYMPEFSLPQAPIN
jgi:hypothetical protein